MTIAAPAEHMLATTASSGAACAEPAQHAAHGMRLLGLRPTPWPGFMELYLTLPDDEIHVVLQRYPLASALAEIATALTQEKTPCPAITSPR